MSQALLDRAFARARQQIAVLLVDTCVITPSVPPGQTAVPVTVACKAENTPSAGTGSGGFSGRHGGGGNQLTRRFDRTFKVPYGTVVPVAASLHWVEGNETITIADVEQPGTHGLTMSVHGARTGTS